MLFLERGEAEGEERMVRKVFTMGDVLWVSSQRLMAERSYVCPSFATTGSLFEGVSGMKIVAREEGHKGRKAKGIYDQGTKLEGMAITPPTQSQRSISIHIDCHFGPALVALPENLCCNGTLKLISYAPPHNHRSERHLPAYCRLSAAVSTSSSVFPALR